MLPPWSRLEICDEPDGILTFVPSAILVKIGATSVAMYKEIATIIVPTITECMMLPRAAPTINATINGIVAKSPNGKTWLPGKITANKTVIGTKINAVEITAGWPSATAASRQI